MEKYYTKLTKAELLETIVEEFKKASAAVAEEETNGWNRDKFMRYDALRELIVKLEIYDKEN